MTGADIPFLSRRFQEVTHAVKIFSAPRKRVFTRLSAVPTAPESPGPHSVAALSSEPWRHPPAIPGHLRPAKANGLSGFPERPLCLEFAESLSENHVLELLERTDLHHGGRGLRLEHHFLLGEGVDALAGLDRRLADGADLQQARKHEFTDGVLLDVSLDDFRQAFDDGADLFAAQSGVGCDQVQDLGLGGFVFNGGKFLSHAGEFRTPDANVKTP
jgi:hypothetical protein